MNKEQLDGFLSLALRMYKYNQISEDEIINRIINVFYGVRIFNWYSFSLGMFAGGIIIGIICLIKYGV